MTRVTLRPLQPGTLIQGYRDAGDYTDCFVTEIAGPVSQARYVEAFYTTWLFRLERLMLALLIAKPSADEEARQLARGETDRFAAWTVEARARDELLMCDYQGLTRSWLMSRQEAGATRLYFGTVVTPGRREGARRLFSALTWAHRIYARALLRAAIARLRALPPEAMGA